jgi:Tol biopolymer transport system component
MTMHGQQFDRALPDLIVELANASTPDYLEAAIERASSRPQRPAWTFPGRWLPMQLTTQAAQAARVPWRQLGVLALIAILLAAVATAYVGARRSVAPAPPFGRAGNGAIAMERAGDIVAVDHATGTITPIVTGPETDAAPRYFRDGTRIAFERRVDEPADGRLIMVANTDGSGVTAATPEPLKGLLAWNISPDGRDLLVMTNGGGVAMLAVFAIDGSHEPRPLDVDTYLDTTTLMVPSYRPPDGREILVIGIRRGSSTRGIYVVDANNGAILRTLVKPTTDGDIFGAVWSPTGDIVTYGYWPPNGHFIRTRVVSADGSSDRPIEDSPGIAYDQALSDVSNDGTRVVVTYRDVSDASEQSLVVRVNGDGPPVELTCDKTGPDACAPGIDIGNILWAWSPDDQLLLGTSFDDQRSYLADPESGRITPTHWPSLGNPNWQRTAP